MQVVPGIKFCQCQIHLHMYMHVKVMLAGQICTGSVDKVCWRQLPIPMQAVSQTLTTRSWNLVKDYKVKIN